MWDWQNQQLKEMIIVRNRIKQAQKKNLEGGRELWLTWVNFMLFVGLGDDDTSMKALRYGDTEQT